MIPESAAADAIASANRGRSGSLSASRSLPRACSRPDSSTTRNVGRRCSGTLAQSHAARGTTTPVVERSHRSSASSSGSSPAGTAARNSRALLGAGTKLTRRFLGSDRISAVTSSSRRPGTFQLNWSASTRFRVATGTSIVRPSSAAPGSKW